MDSSERVTLRYVPQFTCLAGDCKENCCSGLRVELSEANHGKLTACATGTELAAKVTRLVVLEPPEKRTARLHAYIDADGKECPFLDADWLCSIHRVLGEPALADPCSLFPRVLTESHGRRELSATLACPEAARLCLTTEGAVDLIPLVEGVMARELVVRRSDDAATDPYLALLDDVRQACLAVMNADGVRPPVRVLLLADLAARIAPFFHAGTITFELAKLQAALEELPSRVSAIAARFEATEVADRRAVRAVKEMLIARLPNCTNARFHALARPLLLRDPDAALPAIAAYFTDASVAVEDEQLRDAVLARHARLIRDRDARLDEHLRRYTINAIVKDWYTQRPDLASWVSRLVIRLALSRFATVMHPSLTDLDDAAVDGFQIVAKNVEHVPTFMELCESYLRETKLDNLDGLARLLRV